MRAAKAAKGPIDPQVSALRESASTKDHQARVLSKQLRRLDDLNTMRDVLGFLKDFPEISLSGNEWDRQTHVLAVSNGMLDLKTGQLRPGHPSDLVRVVCPTPWRDLNEPCPRWDQFLLEIFDGKLELVTFMQRLFGYALLGNVREHTMAILWGQGRNGKDTLLETLQVVLGDIATVVNQDVFIDQSSSGGAGKASPHLMSLRGSRLVWASETRESSSLNAAQVKLITGGGTIRARPLYGNEVSFKPSHLAMLITNYKPHLPGDDYAIRQRILLIPFLISFVNDPKAQNERKADEGLGDALVREASGILAWLARGTQDYLKNGLQRPDIVMNSTREYLNSENRLAQFIADCCLVDPNKQTPAGELWKIYQAWCHDQNIRTGQWKDFGDRLGQQGFAYKHTSSGRYYEGIGIRNDVIEQYLSNAAKHTQPTLL